MYEFKKLLETVPLLTAVIDSTLNVDYDFTPESLKKIEAEINRVYPIGYMPVKTTIISYGLYLGEVFIRNIPGASWGPYTEDLYDREIRLDRNGHSFVNYPLKRVLNYWFNRSKALSVYYQMNLDVLNGVIQPEHSSYWKDCDGKYHYRFRWVSRQGDKYIIYSSY